MGFLIMCGDKHTEGYQYHQIISNDDVYLLLFDEKIVYLTKN